MSLIYNDEQLQLLDSAQDFLAARSPVAAQRKLRDAEVECRFDVAVWQDMVALGWSAVAFAEDRGGLDFGFGGFAPIFEQIGRHLSASPLLSSVVLCGSLLERLGGSDQQALLAELISGRQRYALALDEHARHRPQHCQLTARRVSEGYLLNGVKGWVADGVNADGWLVLARLEDGRRALFQMPSNAPGVTVQARQMIDSRNMAALTFNEALAAEAALLKADDTEAELDRVLDRGRACIASELLGCCEVMLEMTLEYLRTRVQFDVPIGSFQALQHRAARLYAQLQLARSAVMAAFEMLDRDQGCALERSRMVSLAKWKANEVAQQVSNEAIQMHGGIGVTDEYDLGLFLKRVRVAQAQLGNSDFHVSRYAQSRLPSQAVSAS